MKGLDENPVRIEKHEEAEQKKEYTLAYSLRKPFKNAILWEYDTEKEELKKADLNSKISMGYHGDVKKENELHMASKSLYLFALNEKNAYKKLRKVGMIN